MSLLKGFFADPNNNEGNMSHEIASQMSGILGREVKVMPTRIANSWADIERLDRDIDEVRSTINMKYKKESSVDA